MKSTAVCRPAAGICDAAESCDGVSDNCPADGFQPAGFECRPAAGACDVAETCTGSSVECPADAFQPDTVVCRESTGPCDPEETCTGSDASCPADEIMADSDFDGVCDPKDNCPTVANADQTDTDGDGLGDACDPCDDTMAAPAISPRLALGRHGIRLSSGMILPYPFTPSLDPVRKGIRVVIRDARNGMMVDATIPGGVFNASAKAGWTVNRAGTVWVYRNGGRVVPLVEGITKVTVRDLSKKTPGKLAITVVSKLGVHGKPHLPMSITLAVDSPVATSGQCAEALVAGK